MRFKAKEYIGLILNFLVLVLIMGCSHSFKIPDTQYDFDSEGEGFVYGKLAFQNRDVTEILLFFRNEETRKQKTYRHDFLEHFYAPRETDFVLRVPDGKWTCVRADLKKTKDEVETKALSLRFSVQAQKGIYLGTWNFDEAGAISVQDEKGTQDGKIAEAYPRLNLNNTQKSIPDGKR